MKAVSRKSLWTSIARWFDAGAGAASADRAGPDWIRVVPFVLLHLGCLGVFWVGWDATAVLVCGALYLARMFFITGFYHRYFCHRSFRVSRPVQFVFALLGCTAGQRGPLWWAAHHRHHHKHSDTKDDYHSPNVHGFFWSHMGWFTSPAAFATNHDLVPDLARYPELRFLDRFDSLVPIALATTLFLIGGWTMLVWGFFVSTVVLFHATCCINSLAHRVGRRRYETADHSRNSFLLAILTLGEGWHNNHHHYPGSARQGFRWWEIDLTFYGLTVLSWLGVVRDLRPVPEKVLRA